MMKSSPFNFSRAFAVAAALVTLISLGGCASPRPAPRETAGADPGYTLLNADRAGAETNLPPFKADTIHVGDRVTVTFSGLSTPLLPHDEQVREDGQIKPPMLSQPVMAAGKTVGDLQDELHRLYVPAFFKTLTVTVTIPERYFWVGGEVKMPGQKPYLSQMTVVKAIQAAGDFTDFANRRSVIITRTDNTTEIVDCKKAIRNPKLDLPVYPGDKIHVPRRSF